MTDLIGFETLLDRPGSTFRRARLGLLFVSLCQISSNAGAVEPSKNDRNPRFTVATTAQGGFRISDRVAEKTWQTPAMDLFGRWQLIPAGHWLSYQKVTTVATISCLLDLKTQTSSCAGGLALEPGEGPWSPSGRWLAWKSPDLTQLHFSDSESAGLSKEGTLPAPELSIGGDPLGQIWQQKWLSDEELLVGTGSGESVCYGIFDFNQLRFYSLACCATLEELSRATGNPQAWLTEKGLLADRARWRLADPRNFPWKLE